MEVVYIEKQTKQKKLFILFFVRLSLTNKFLTPPLLNPLEKNLGATTVSLSGIRFFSN